MLPWPAPLIGRRLAVLPYLLLAALCPENVPREARPPQRTTDLTVRCPHCLGPLDVSAYGLPSATDRRLA